MNKTIMRFSKNHKNFIDIEMIDKNIFYAR